MVLRERVTATTIYRILVVGHSARRISGEVLNFGNSCKQPAETLAIPVPGCKRQDQLASGFKG